MVKRVDSLTPEQKARMDSWADEWIGIGLRTGPADRPAFEAAARKCYEFAGIPWPGRVVWVSSPIVLAIAAPVAALCLQLARKRGGAVGGAVRGAVDDAVRGAVGGAVRGAVDDAVDDAVRGAVGGAVRGAVDDAVGDAVDDAVRGAVGGAVDDAVRGAVGGAVRGAVDDAVDDAVRGAVGGAVDDAVRGAVDGAVGGAVGDAVDGAVGDAVDDAVGGAKNRASDQDRAIRQAVAQVIARGWVNYIGGQLWVSGYWWGGAFTSFFREVCSLELADDQWARGIAYETTMKSACWWYPHRDFVMVCERPTVINRELVNPARPRGFGSHRLHCDDGPAVAWPDGWGVWAVHGVRVTQQIVEHPESITVEQIRKETNAEIRRVMLTRYGYERYVRDAKLKLVDHMPADHELVGLRTARLYRDGDIVLLDMLNSTPEPDGSVKRYVLPVDPQAYEGRASHECLAAMASTWRRRSDPTQLFFKRPEDYSPVAES